MVIKQLNCFPSLIQFALFDIACQDNVGKLEVDAANCKTIFLSEYVVVFFLLK